MSAHELEVCPSCGRYASLDEESGWCVQCTGEHHPEYLRCGRCSKPYASSSGGKFCTTCKEHQWIERNADALEEWMAHGLSYAQARQRVLDGNRPRCLACGEVVKGAPRTRFCSKTTRCKWARRRYRTLVDGHARLPSNLALEQVLRELEVRT